MTATGVRTSSGPGGHKKTVEYARHVLAHTLSEDEFDALDDLRQERARSEYDDPVDPDPDLVNEYLDLVESVINKVAGELTQMHKGQQGRST